MTPTLRLRLSAEPLCTGVRGRGVTRIAAVRIAAVRIAATLALLMVVLGCDHVGPGAGGGGGIGNPYAPPPATSPDGVTALGLVIGVPSPEGMQISVQLGVMAREAGVVRYIGGASDTSVEVDGEVYPLLSTTTGGIFATDGVRSRGLVYAPDTDYTFHFAVTAENGERVAYASTITSPPEQHHVALVDMPIRFAGEEIELELHGMWDGGAIAVIHRADPMMVTHNTFDFQGPESIEAARRSLESFPPRFAVVPRLAVAVPGHYTIEVHNYAIDGPSLPPQSAGTLSTSSWFAAGLVQPIELELH